MHSTDVFNSQHLWDGWSDLTEGQGSFAEQSSAPHYHQDLISKGNIQSLILFDSQAHLSK